MSSTIFNLDKCWEGKNKKACWFF